MKDAVVFTTSDTDLASTLVSMGYKVIKIDRANPQRVIFGFEDNPLVRADIEKYNKDLLQLQPQRLFSSYRYIKSLIFQKNDDRSEK